MTAARRSASRSGSRRSRRSRGGGDRSLGRLVRGVLEFLLVVVLLLFAASLLGLLSSRGVQEGQTGDEGWGGGRPQILPAVAPAGGEGFGEAGDRVAGRRSLPPIAPFRSSPGHAAIGAAPPIRLHLANGCGVARLAARMREAFRGSGFDVLGISNADTDSYRETIVVRRSAERLEGEAVVTFLRERWGVGRLISQERSSPTVDVLVILGQDLADALEDASAGHSTR